MKKGKSKRLGNKEIIIALIGAVALVLSALIGSPLAMRFFATSSTPTVITATPTSVTTGVSTTSSNGMFQLLSRDPQQFYTNVTQQPPSWQDPLTSQDGNNWPIYHRPDHACFFEGGHYEATASSIPTTECATGISQSGNISLRCQMTIKSGDGGGLLIVDTLTSQIYRLDVRSNGAYDLYMPRDQRVLRYGYIGGISINQPFSVAMIADEGTLFLYVNDRFITQISVENQMASFGSIGVFAAFVHTPTDVIFHDLEMWQL